MLLLDYSEHFRVLLSGCWAVLRGFRVLLCSSEGLYSVTIWFLDCSDICVRPESKESV